MIFRIFGAFLIFIFSVLPASSNEVFIIPIEGVIDGGLAKFVERAVGEAEEKGARAIILKVNTPGGRVDSAVLIRDAVLNAKQPTIAYIGKNAISAGALISLSCKQIFMEPGSSIGAATAVDLQGKKASEKVISYMRAEMRATAEATGRDPLIAEAMVDEEIEIPEVIKKGKLLTLTTEEAYKLGISDRTVKSIDEVLDFINLSGVSRVVMKPNWAENVVRFLTHPVVSSLLMTLGFLGLIFEVKTPGWSVGGTIGLIALALFFGSHLIVKLAGFEAVLLFGLGITFLIAEVFFIPGFGIAGVLGILCMILSVILSLIGRFPTPQDISNAFTVLGASIIMTIIFSYFIFKYMPRTSIYGKIVLNTSEKVSEGWASQENYAYLVGAQGVAYSALRPSGTGIFEGKRIAVVTQGEFILKGTAITVIQVEGARVVVQAV